MMRRRPVDGQLGADADAADHEAELVVEAVGENSPEVVDDHRVEDRKGRHGRTDVDQHLGPRIAPGERIDGELGGEGAEPDGAAHRGLGIGVLQPVVQEGKSAFDADGDEDQVRSQAAEAEGAEFDRAGVGDVKQGAGQQQDARAHLNDEIAHAGAIGALRAARPDQEDRRDGGQFPEHEKGDQVAGIDRADGPAGIDQRRHLLRCVRHLERVEHVDGGRREEDDSEHGGQPVDPEGRQLEAEELHLAIRARIESEDQA
jgi:hypothetical protein